MEDATCPGLERGLMSADHGPQPPRPPVVHVVESTTDTVRSGYLDPGAPPVATIEPGDVVSYPNTWTHWGNEATYGMTFAEREPLRHRYPNGPYSMMGPVEVTGAEPGDIVGRRLLTLRTRDWGWNSFPLGVGALPHDFAKPYVHYFRFDADRTGTEYVQGITLPLAPFLGVMAVEPAGNDPVSAILAGSYGGNLVLRELTVGSSLFLPVAKPGGRIWVGDVHALQGGGVVDQTAIETAAEDLQIRYDLHKHVGPQPRGGMRHAASYRGDRILFCHAVFDHPSAAQLQRLSGPDHGALGLRLSGTTPIGSILSGWIISAGGPRVAFLVGSGACLAAALLAAFVHTPPHPDQALTDLAQ